MKEKNKSFSCNGNQEADSLLYMTESNAVLSESLTGRIRRIVLVIITNLKGNEDFVNEEIAKLKEEMLWVSIFSESFIHSLNSRLLLCLAEQKKLEEKLEKEKSKSKSEKSSGFIQGHC